MNLATNDVKQYFVDLSLLLYYFTPNVVLNKLIVQVVYYFNEILPWVGKKITSVPQKLDACFLL